MGTDKRGHNGDVINVLLIVFISLLFISPALLPTSPAALTPDADFHIETIERPFFRNVTQITHNDELIYIGTDANGLVIYDQETGTFEVKNTSNSFPLNSVDFVQWEVDEELLFFTSRENLPYPENTSIVPWVYSYDDGEVVPIGDMVNYRSKTSLLVEGGNIYLNGWFMLYDYKNANIDEIEKNVHFFDGRTMIGVHFSDTSNDLLVIDDLYYMLEETFEYIDEIVYSSLVRYNLSDPKGVNNIHYFPESVTHLLSTQGNSYVYTLSYNNVNTIYIGSSQGIIFVKADDMNKTGNITVEDGLISNEILDLEYSQSMNTLFASSKDGLSIIDLTTNNIINLNKTHSLLSDKMNSIDWNEERSELYIGHDTGISILRFDTHPGIPEIHHTPLTTGTVGEKIRINATITGGNPIESAHVCYRPLEQANFTCMEMQLDGNDYSAEIPALATPDTMQYYIRATDIYGNENSTDVHEIEVSRQDEVTQEKAGFIPGMSMNMSIIILVLLIVAGAVGAVMLRERRRKAKRDDM